MVLTVKMDETAGGVGERVVALEEKLKVQGDAMAAMQRDMAEMRRAMALLKGMAATGASAERSEVEGAGKGSASGEAAEDVAAQLLKGAQEKEVEELKVLAGAAMWKAQDVAAEMGPVKAEMVRRGQLVRNGIERNMHSAGHVQGSEQQHSDSDHREYSQLSPASMAKEAVIYCDEHHSIDSEMATATAPRDMELRLVNGMVLKVQLAEMAGSVGERVAALEAKLREQGDAMASMQRDLAEMRRAMALLKGVAATGGLGEKREGEGAGNGSASREAAEGIGARPLKGARENIFAAIEAEELKAQVETARAEARDAASEMRGEVGAMKAELARMRAAAERQAAEVAYVKATAAHSEARINDAELALAAIKDERKAEKSRAERNEGSAREDVGEERREGKRRKREEAGQNEVGVVADAGGALIAISGAHVEKKDEAERNGGAEGGEIVAACDTKAELQGLRARVKALEEMSAVGGKTWESLSLFDLTPVPSPCSWLQVLMMLWREAVPSETFVKLQGVPCLTDSALTELASFHSLTSLNLTQCDCFTAAGVKGLFSLTGLTYLNLSYTATTDGALDGIDGLKNLEHLFLENTDITDAGIAKLQGMTALRALFIPDCASVTSASMVHVAKLIALEVLALPALQRLTALTSLTFLALPPAVTDSGMKYLRNMKHLETLGLWDASITAAGVKWLKGLKWLQKITTDDEDVQELVRDIFPGMIVTPGPL
ncbi:unnamed protein product [Closterium sp. Yama58-4]|nr:unnamed protein product [Closterium sp. Yama58-4]